KGQELLDFINPYSLKGFYYLKALKGTYLELLEILDILPTKLKLRKMQDKDQPPILVSRPRSFLSELFIPGDIIVGRIFSHKERLNLAKGFCPLSKQQAKKIVEKIEAATQNTLAEEDLQDKFILPAIHENLNFKSKPSTADSFSDLSKSLFKICAGTNETTIFCTDTYKVFDWPRLQAFFKVHPQIKLHAPMHWFWFHDCELFDRCFSNFYKEDKNLEVYHMSIERSQASRLLLSYSVGHLLTLKSSELKNMEEGLNDGTALKNGMKLGLSLGKFSK
ncbi:MAG: hypothetical protein IJU40_05965, partial [Desulfovibrionaceae bacterium]|nr:hypothetical protein [Desulfovibrionaceae bacterium]